MFSNIIFSVSNEITISNFYIRQLYFKEKSFVRERMNGYKSVSRKRSKCIKVKDIGQPSLGLIRFVKLGDFLSFSDVSYFKINADLTITTYCKRTSICRPERGHFILIQKVFLKRLLNYVSNFRGRVCINH